jgi:hypothetical protein
MRYLLLGYNQTELNALLQENSKEFALEKIAKHIYRNGDKCRIVVFGDGGNEVSDGDFLDMMYSCGFQTAQLKQVEYYIIKSAIYAQFVSDVALCVNLPENPRLSIQDALSFLESKIS